MAELTRHTQPMQPMQRPEITDLLEPLQMLFGLQPQSYGIDPDKDVEITVTDGVLTIHAGHTEQQAERHHSEFRRRRQRCRPG